MHVVHDDGTEQEIRAGQADVIEPGHDAWVVGDEAVVGFESTREQPRSTRKAEHRAHRRLQTRQACET